MTFRSHPASHAAELAAEVYRRVLESVQADRLVESAVSRQGDILFIQDEPIDLSRYRRVLIAGAGKASSRMALKLEEILGDRLTNGLIVTKHGHCESVSDKIETIESSHPVPDLDSIDAGRRMLEFARGTDEGDLVIFVLSGGASALMESLKEGISLEDLQETNRRLLASGQSIHLINSVRSALSQTKAGGLARAFSPSDIVVLVLSDVVGNDLRAVGSGPFTPPGPIEIPWDLTSDLPESVRLELLSFSLLSYNGPRVPHFVLGSVSLVVQYAMDHARSLGLDPLAFQDPLQGEARQMARDICALAKRASRERPNGDFCMIFGGETVVSVRGNGIGGRCQEMAVAAMTEISKISHCAFLAGSTDGTDGPTDAAGALIDSGSLSRARQAGLNPRDALVRNDTNPFLAKLDSLVHTGPTGSNLNDLCLVVRATDV